MFKRSRSTFCLVPVVLNGVRVSIAKKAIDAALNVIEADMAALDMELDDVIVKPCIRMLRDMTEIPDDFEDDDD